MDPVAGNRSRPLHRAFPLELQGYEGRGLFEAFTMPPEMQAIGPQARPHGVDQDGLQIAAVDGELRPLVTGGAAERLAVDELAVAVEEGRLLRLDRDFG